MNSQLWSSLLSVALPPVIDIINNRIKNTMFRYWIALVASSMLGLIAAFISGEFNPETILSSIGSSFIVAQTIYKQFWVDSSTRKSYLKKI